MYTASGIGKPATTDEIQHIIGNMSGHLLHDIRRIGPTLEEVCEARGCLDVSPGIQQVMERQMHARTRKVFLLLKNGGKAKQTSCCGACA